MPIKNESFLVLEKSLADRLMSAVVAYSAPLFEKIDDLVDEGKFIEAEDLAEEYNPEEAVRSQRKFVYTIGLQALVFGAREFHASKHTSFVKEGPPELLEIATDAIVSAVSDSLREVKDEIQILLSRLEAQAKEDMVEKADFVKNISNFAKRSERNKIDIGASLHTSRVASYGFLVEAEIMGYASFTVSAIIDGRTSEICQIMDGQVFHVAPARAKIERWLSVDNAKDLKNIAPWPKNSPAAIEELRNMTVDDLQARGWDTPPYHPHCRTILRKTMKVVETQNSIQDQVLTAIALASAAADSDSEAA